MKKRHIANCPVSSSWWEFTKCIHLQVQWRFFIFFVHLILIIREVIYKILIIREVFHPILMMQGGPAVLRPVLQRAVCSALCKMPRLHHIGDFHNQYWHLHLYQHQHCQHHHQQQLIDLHHDNLGLHSWNGPVLALSLQSLSTLPVPLWRIASVQWTSPGTRNILSALAALPRWDQCGNSGVKNGVYKVYVWKFWWKSSFPIQFILFEWARSTSYNPPKTPHKKDDGLCIWSSKIFGLCDDSDLR